MMLRRCFNLRDLWVFYHLLIKSYLQLRKSEDPADRIEFSLDTLCSDNPNKPYDMKELITKVVDDRDFFETQPDYAANIITGFAQV